MRFNNTVVGLKIDDLYNVNIRKNLISKLKEIGTDINFDDKVWFCDKTKKSVSISDAEVTIDYSKILEKYESFIKYFAIKHHAGTSTIKTIIKNFNEFLQFCVQKYGEIELKELNRNIMEDYKKKLRYNLSIGNNEKQKRWCNVRVFLKTMEGWPELPMFTLISSQDNPFKRKTISKKNDDNYPPKEVIDKLDWIFINENYIPTCVKLFYFYIRLHPNRGSDIRGILIENCLRPFGNMYTITIPNLKKSNEGAIKNKILYINTDAEIEKIFIKLILKQKEISKKCQHLLPENKKGLLFSFPRFCFDKSGFKNNASKKYKISDSKVCIANASMFNAEFHNICDIYNLQYKGEKYYVTPKQFRHKEITDRLDNGFTGLETKSDSGQTSDIMYTTYDHGLEEEQEKIHNEYNGENERRVGLKNNIEFDGLIMGEISLERLLRKRQSYELITPDNYHLGVCSNKFSCSVNNVIDPYLCLGCNEHASENETNSECVNNNYKFIDFYKKQAEIWNKDYIFFSNNNNVIYKEIAKRNLDECIKMLGKFTNVIKSL